MSVIYSNNGTDKARGLENAALQHAKHLSHANGRGQKPAATDKNSGHSSAAPVQTDTFERSQTQPPSTSVYTATGQKTESAAAQTTSAGTSNWIIGNGAKVTFSGSGGTSSGNDTVIIGNGAKVHFSGSGGQDSGDDTLIIGNGAKVNFSGSGGVDSGDDTVIIGNGAKVNFSGSGGTDSGDDTIIIGNGAKVNFSSSGGTDNGNDTLIIGNGAKVTINGSLQLDTKNGSGFSFEDGTLRLNVIDDQKNAFQFEWRIKDKEKATELQSMIEDKLKNNKLSGDEFAQFLQQLQEKASVQKTEQKTESAQLKKDEEVKAMSRGELRLSIMKSLVQDLYKSQSNNGLHKGWKPAFDWKI